MHVGIVAGEASGDELGAGLISAMREHWPDVRFSGICGPRMCKLGARSLFPMDRISVMGLEGLWRRLPEILRIRRAVCRYLLDAPVDLFVGIDVPDFNLSLERRLRGSGIATVHYVSPTVWAWRRYRIRRIRRAVDRMLTLFPFEARFYEECGIPVTFVGHPLAEEIGPDNSASSARSELRISENRCVIALLPGSRLSEIERMGPVFLDTAKEVSIRRADVLFLLPAAGREAYARLVAMSGRYPGLDIEVINGRSRAALTACDAALVASGTAALEAALLARPMVVAYKVSKLTYWYVKLFSAVQHYSMPNHLLDHPIVPELLQEDATPENLAARILEYLQDGSKAAEMRSRLSGIHKQLHRDANRAAAEAVMLTFAGTAQAGASAMRCQ